MKLLSLLVLASTLAGAASAQTWPTQPVRIIVPSSAGAAPDNMIRLIAARLSPQLQQAVVVENRVGAGGIVAKQAFNLARDDHTFLLTLTSTTTVAPLLFKAASGFDYLRDTQPVMTLGESPFMIVAHPGNGAQSLADLLRMARAQPGAVAFATPPLSSIAQLSVAVLSQATGAKFNVVPFSRSADSLAAVSTGDAAFFVDTVSVVLPFVRAKRVQPIAVLSSTKLPGLEEVPLARDTVPGFVVVASFGLVAPKNAAPAVVQAMYRATSVALKDPELIRKLQDMAIYLRPGDAAAYRAALSREADFWSKVISSANIKPE
jgi:tripartite-type tricarboxylate transporter receptor subunit TctC